MISSNCLVIQCIGLLLTFCAPEICVVMMLILLFLSGAVTTFTMMMLCSKKASADCRATHYSTLATAEVLGKLVFSVFVGSITDLVVYPVAFTVFLMLAALVLPLFRFLPASCRQNGDFCDTPTKTS